MNEQRTILDLLEQGKISAEQAEMLIAALNQPKNEHQRHRKHIPTFDKPKWDKTTKDLKTLGTQMSSMVTQALGEAKKEIESQLGDWLSHNTILQSRDIELQSDITQLSVEIMNGKIYFPTL